MRKPLRPHEPPEFPIENTSTNRKSALEAVKRLYNSQRAVPRGKMLVGLAYKSRGCTILRLLSSARPAAYSIRPNIGCWSHCLRLVTDSSLLDRFLRVGSVHSQAWPSPSPSRPEGSSSGLWVSNHCCATDGSSKSPQSYLSPGAPSLLGGG